MQDIRKPYTRSRSNNDLQSRVEQFESARYRRDDYDEDPVQIPVKKQRRDIHDMDMYPRRAQEEELYEDDSHDERLRRNAHRDDIHSRKARRRVSINTILFIFAMIALVVGVALYTYVFDTATITIVPKYKDIATINQPFIFSREGGEGTGIPFITASTSLTQTKTLSLSESRKVEAKASGKITIYNNFDSSPQKLIKNTRFESSKGKIYRINQSIEVPGKKAGVPGSIEVTVYADSTGAEYNIASADFTIPGFKGSARESAFYAKTKTPISGGSSGNMSLASLSDVNAAKDSLALELEKTIKEEAKKVQREGYTPLYSASEITYEDNENEILNGSTAIYKVTATIHVILVNSSLFAEALAKTFGDYDNAPVRLSHADTLVYTRKETEKVTTSDTFSILVEGKPRIVWESDIESIKAMVTGKSRDDFKPLMKTINSIESAEISFSPRWLTHFPSENNKLIVIESLPKR
jgi:hypothetical protein